MLGKQQLAQQRGVRRRALLARQAPPRAVRAARAGPARRTPHGCARCHRVGHRLEEAAQRRTQCETVRRAGRAAAHPRQQRLEITAPSHRRHNAHQARAAAAAPAAAEDVGEAWARRGQHARECAFELRDRMLARDNVVRLCPTRYMLLQCAYNVM